MEYIGFSLKCENSKMKTTPLVMDTYSQWLCYLELARKVRCLTKPTNTITLSSKKDWLITIVVSNWESAIDGLQSEKFFNHLKEYGCRWVWLWDVLPVAERMNVLNPDVIGLKDYRGDIPYEEAFHDSIGELYGMWNANEVEKILHNSEHKRTVWSDGKHRKKEKYEQYDLLNYTFEINTELNWDSISEPIYSINSANFMGYTKRVQYNISNGYFKLQIYIHNSLL